MSGEWEFLTDGVECPHCGKPVVMTVGADLGEDEQDTFKILVEATPPLGLCCVDLIDRGIDQVVGLLGHVHSVTGRRITLEIDVPNLEIGGDDVVNNE